MRPRFLLLMIVALVAPIDLGGESLNIHTAVELEITTDTDAIYELQSSVDMAIWTTEGIFNGTGETWFSFRTIRGDDRRFWRLQKTFVLIPGGSFTMGRTSGDTDANAPPITVTVQPFYLQRTETTKAQWNEVRAWATSNGYIDIAPGGGKGAEHPIHTISWWDAVKWCNARSEKEGLTPVYMVGGEVMRVGTMEPDVTWNADGYRLPTEAEWEKAARGGLEGKRFPWGTDTINHNNANYTANSNSFSYDTSGYAVNTYHPAYATGNTPYTSPVASFDANGYGLFDMAGNVWEWCWDWYGSSYYNVSAGTSDPHGPASGTGRVSRGGRWNYPANWARCGFRDSITPGNALTGSGFRPARSVAP